jgi:hypothetical protein
LAPRNGSRCIKQSTRNGMDLLKSLKYLGPERNRDSVIPGQNTENAGVHYIFRPSSTGAAFSALPVELYANIRTPYEPNLVSLCDQGYLLINEPYNRISTF